MNRDPRKGLYAKVAIARKQLGMDDEVYREKLRTEYGVTSAKALNVHQLARLVHSLAAPGATYTKRAFGVSVFVWLHDGKQIATLLSDLQRREKSFDKKLSEAPQTEKRA